MIMWLSAIMWDCRHNHVISYDLDQRRLVMRHWGHVITYCTSTSSINQWRDVQVRDGKASLRYPNVPYPKEKSPIEGNSQSRNRATQMARVSDHRCSPTGQRCSQAWLSWSIGWSNAELRALVEFILLHGTGESWPTHHRMRVWEAAIASFHQV